MHELSIAAAVADVARRHARGRRVTRIEVKVGHLRQVVPSALGFAFELVTQGTELEGAELALEEVAARGRCRACGEESRLAGFPFACAACGGFELEVTAGEELRVDALEIDEPAAGERLGEGVDSAPEAAPEPPGEAGHALHSPRLRAGVGSDG